MQLKDNATNAHSGATLAATLTPDLPANGRCLACDGSCFTSRNSFTVARNSVSSLRRMSWNDSSLLESPLPLRKQFSSNYIHGSMMGGNCPLDYDICGNCFECSRVTDNCSNCLIHGSKEKSKLPVIYKLHCYCKKNDRSCIKVDYDYNISSEQKCDLDKCLTAATSNNIGNNQMHVVEESCGARHQRLINSPGGSNAAHNFGAEIVEQLTATKVDIESKIASESNCYKNRFDLSQSITNDIHQRQSTCAADVNSKLTFNGRSGGPWRSGFPGWAQLALILTCFVTLSSGALVQNTNSVIPRGEHNN